MLKFRPAPDAEDHWEDNWLSNAMAWVSEKLFPDWCKNSNHWTVRLVLYLWADCSCCLFFRGVAVGAIVGLALGLAFFLLFI